MKQFFSGKAGRIAVILLPLAALLAVLLFVRGKTTPFHAMPSQAAVVLEWRSFFETDKLAKSTADPAWAAVLNLSLIHI